MYELTIETSFSSAHNLKGYDGACENLHGHNWRVEVSIASKELDNIGMVLDFKVLKAITNEVVERLDHKYLNETPPFDAVNPTAEHIAAYIFKEVASALEANAAGGGGGGGNIRVSFVKVWESEKSAATYSE